MADKCAMETEKYLNSSICQPVSIVLEHLSPKAYQSKLKKGIKKKHQQKKERKGKEKINNEETLLTSQRYSLRNRYREHANKEMKRNDDTTKEVFTNTRHIDTWKYKRKYNISSSEESDSNSVNSTKQRKRKKVTLPEFQQNNNKFTIDNLFYLSINSNITDAKVALVRLEDVHDDKYIKNWKKKVTQGALSTKNVKHSEQYKNLSTSTSSIDTVVNSPENIIKDIENSTSAKKSVSLCDLKPRHKQYKNLEVLLVKLESLGVSFNKPTLASKVEKLTAKYNDTFRLNPLTYSNNVVSNSSQSNIINEHVNETSVSVSSVGEENDVINRHSTNKTLVNVTCIEDKSNMVNQHSPNETSVDMSYVEEESDIVNLHSANETLVNVTSIEEESDMENQHSKNETSVNTSFVQEEDDVVNPHSTKETLVNVTFIEEESNTLNQHFTNETSVNTNSVQEENDVINRHSTNETLVNVTFIEEESNTLDQHFTNETSVNMSYVEVESDIVNQHSKNETSVNTNCVQEENDVINRHSISETLVNVTCIVDKSNMVNQHSTNQTSVNTNSVQEENDVINRHSISETLVNVTCIVDKSNMVNQHSTNQTSVNTNSVQEETDIVNGHSTSEPTTNSSLSDSILQSACNVKEFSLKSRPREHQESTKNVENIRVSERLVLQTTENAILPKQAEKSQNISSLTSVDEASVVEASVTETSVNNETRTVDFSNNLITEKGIDKASLEKNSTTVAEKTGGLDSANSAITIVSTNIEQRINDAFRYTCIACNSSFNDFRALPLHLRKCLAKSQEKKIAHDNNNKVNVSSDSVEISETLKCDNTSKSSLIQPPSTTNDGNSNSTPLSLKKKLARRRWKSLKLLNKQLQQKSNVQCNVCSEIFDTMMSLSDHIYTHTESELRRAYEIAKMKQISIKNSEENNVLTADTNENTKSAAAATERKEAENADATTKQKKTKSVVAITKHKKAKSSDTTTEHMKIKSPVATTECREAENADATAEHKKAKSSVATTKHEKAKSFNTVAEHKKTKNPVVPTEQKQAKNADATTERKEAENADAIIECKGTETADATNEQKQAKSADATNEQKQAKSAVATPEQKKAKESTIAIESQRTQVGEISNTSLSVVTESPKRMSNLPPVNYVSPVKFCDCHKPLSSDERCIELVLHCCICKVIFRTKECFDAHLKKVKSSLCNSKQLIGTVQRLYCSACQIILYSFVDMRRHTENHVKNHQHIKLFCHICKVRFIGVGPIFNLHWFNHMRNLSYTATASNFPKASLVDSNSKIWSLITSDNYNYLIVTEHVCNFCNEQLFSTNQLQKHVSACTKRKDIELSRRSPENNDKEHDIDSELNLRLFCTLCKVIFKEKSLFETHAVSHKQHLQPQYICLSLTDIKRMYICNVCANVYDDLKEFQTHWQNHNAIREIFMCYQCKNSFLTLETFIDHSKQCDMSSIPLQEPSCQVTYFETVHSCKICNIGFDSYKALYQHSGIHNIKFSRLSIASPSEAQNGSIIQDISSSNPDVMQIDTKQLAVVSNHSTEKITVEEDSTPNILKDIAAACTQSKLSAESKAMECVENEVDHLQIDTSVNDNLNITDADTEVLSEYSDIEMEEINKMVQESYPGGDENLNDSISKDKESKIIVTKNVSPSDKPSVTHVQSDEKTETRETDMEDDVILIEPEVISKKTKINKEAIVTGKETKIIEEPAITSKERKISKEPAVTSKETKISKEAVVTSKETKISKESVVTSKETKISKEAVVTSKETKIIEEPAITSKETKISKEPAVTSKETEISKEAVVTSKETKISKESVVTSKETKISKEAVVTSKETKISKESVVTSKETKISKESVVTSKETKETKCTSPAKVPEKNNATPKEAMSDSKPNDTSKSSEKPVHKYLRVKNISELMDQKVKYTCPTCGTSFDNKMTLENHSKLHNQQLPTSLNSQKILLPKPLSGGDLKHQNINMPPNQNSSYFQQHCTTAAVPDIQIPIPVQNINPYSVSQVTQRNINIAPTQYSNLPIRTVIHNVNTGKNMNNTRIPSTSVQPQNFYPNNQVLFQTLPLSNLQDPSNNFLNNNQLIQTSNNVARIVLTNQTAMSTSNVISKPAYSGVQCQDTHSRIKLQNAIHQKCSDKTISAAPINILPKPAPTQTLIFKPITGPSISSSNQYYTNENFPGIYSSADVSNLPKNNTMTTINTNNAGQTSTFYQTSTVSSSVAPTFVQHTVRHGPTQFSDLNVRHIYSCEICNQRLFSSEDLKFHKLKHSSICTKNTFQS